MYDLRNELIKTIIAELKISNNPFNVETIKGYIAHISEGNLESFYSKLFTDGAGIFNGLDRVAKVAEQFKPKDTKTELKAKELIELVEGINTSVSNTTIGKGIDFAKYVRENIRLTISEDDIAILDRVKPYINHKELIINIRRYPTAKDSLDAFIYAIKYNNIDTSNLIADKRVKKLIPNKGAKC